MTTYIRNPLTYVWAFLTAITVASWWISQDVGLEDKTSALATIGVLLIAAVKVHCVIRYFMEVRHSPLWLKRATAIWLAVLVILLLVFYCLHM